ncbi:hypothetical protein FSP39_018691 [Pinctada imbricata]|uniref:Uncharacterized protein n=1 Tax=Pinctada imbricata TaxID=66713 RepID=A0AA88YRV5_PINIB|nr:hypothetical protein FSP39_018691 [Pinctada imbricata]
MTSNFVNIFKQTLLKHVNDSTTRVNDVRTETDRLAKKMEELGQFKLDNQVMTDKLTFLQDEVQSVVDSQLFTEGEIDAFKQSSNENVRENQNKIRELGDTHEFGEDHCQFVGATDPKAAYYRAEWNDSLTFGTLNMMRPTV